MRRQLPPSESEPVTALAIKAKAAQEAKQMGSLLVHYSTDYVFDGTKREPWVESDPPHPLGVYGKTKWAGEEAIQNVGRDYLTFRTSWVYGSHGSNLLLTMLRLAQQRTELKIVGDQIGAPTTSIELANATRSIVGGVIEGRYCERQNWAGLYHMTCSGYVSCCGFAQAIVARVQTQLHAKVPSVHLISSLDYPVIAQRPLYSVLSNEKLRSKFKLQLPTWESSLDDVFEHLVIDDAKLAYQL